MTDKELDAAIERLGEAAFEYGKKISDYLEVFPNGFRSEAFEDAERDLRAIIAVRGRGVVVEDSVVECFARKTCLLCEFTTACVAQDGSSDAALAAKEQG